MRVLHVTPFYPPAPGRGGMARAAGALCPALAARGHQVTVFACADSDVPCELVTTLSGPYGLSGAPDDWQLCEWINLCRAVEQSALRHRMVVLLG